MFFSSGIIGGYERIGLLVTPEEKASWHNLWMYVGYLCGVQEGLLTKTYAEQVEAQKVVVAHSYGPNDCTPLLWKGALRGVSQGAAKLPWSVWLCGGGLLSSKTFLEQVRLPCLPARCPSSPFARPRTSTHPLLPGRRSFTAAARR